MFKAAWWCSSVSLSITLLWDVNTIKYITLLTCVYIHVHVLFSWGDFHCHGGMMKHMRIAVVDDVRFPSGNRPASDQP